MTDHPDSEEWISLEDAHRRFRLDSGRFMQLLASQELRTTTSVTSDGELCFSVRSLSQHFPVRAEGSLGGDIVANLAANAVTGALGYVAGQVINGPRVIGPDDDNRARWEVHQSVLGLVDRLQESRDFTVSILLRPSSAFFFSGCLDANESAHWRKVAPHLPIIGNSIHDEIQRWRRSGAVTAFGAFIVMQNYLEAVIRAGGEAFAWRALKRSYSFLPAVPPSGIDPNDHTQREIARANTWNALIADPDAILLLSGEAKIVEGSVRAEMAALIDDCRTACGRLQ